VVVPAHKMLQYSFDTPYSFRQESNFLYLTGVKEPDLTLVINTETGESIIFLPEQNDYQKEWDGDLDRSKIIKISGIKNIKSEIHLKKVVDEAVKKGLKIGILPPSDDRIEPYGFYANPARKLLVEKLDRDKDNFIDIRKNIAILRQIKSDSEIQEIKKAIEVTGKSLEYIKNIINKYSYEQEVQKDLTINFLKNGGDKHGFDPIVANEKNAATIHYKENSGEIVDDSLILLDVGAQVGDYSADVSRTYEIGSTSNKQKDVLKAVLDVQQELVAMVKPGLTIKHIQEITEEKLAKKYKELKITSRKLPHGVSHHLGLDVHDAADYSAILAENMVITIEPGIYLPEEKIGVRIEDDLLITNNGNINLSGHIPY
jgi:Xaa-Pro aminopeptidase